MDAAILAAPRRSDRGAEVRDGKHGGKAYQEDDATPEARSLLHVTTQEPGKRLAYALCRRAGQPLRAEALQNTTAGISFGAA